MSNIEHRAVIKFLIKEGVPPKEIKCRLDNVYTHSSPSYSSVKKWAALFRMGRESLEDDERSGRPVIAMTDQNIALVEQEVNGDRRLKAKEIAARVGISKTTVLRILHEHLHMNKVSARWVPKLLSSIQKERRVECCQEFLDAYQANKSKFIQSIVTGDETMVLYYDPLSKRESMEWRRPGEAPPRKARVAPSTKKMMATIFWDCEGILMIDFKERNTVINGSYYASLLHRLKDSIKEIRRDKLSRGIHLLHDNAPVHTAAVAKRAILDCGFTELNHPPYSPDLAPSDYYLFSKLKSDLRGKKFTSDDEIKSAVFQHFQSKDKNYFYTGIEMLISRSNKCINLLGDYIEK